MDSRLIFVGLAIGLCSAGLLWRMWRQQRTESLTGRMTSFLEDPALFDDHATQELLVDVERAVHKARMAQDQGSVQRMAGRLQQLCLGALGKEGIASEYLTNQALISVHNGDVETTILLLGTGAELFHRQPDGNHGQALENLRLLCHAAYKARQRIVLVQIAEILTVLLACTTSSYSYAASLKVLGDIGLVAMRLKDEAMFGEIIHLNQEGLQRAHGVSGEKLLIELLENWLHHMITTGDGRYYVHFQELALALIAEGRALEKQTDILLKQWCHAAAIAARNPHSPYGPWIMELSLRVICRKDFSGSRRHAISMIFQVAEQQVVYLGLRDGFVMVRPVLECGRKILIQQQAFRYWQAEERREMLYLLVRGCTALAATMARKEIMLTPGEVIGEIYELWCQQSDAGEKFQRSMKRFCQLVHLYWQKTWWRQAKKQERPGKMAGSGKWNQDTAEMLEKIL